MIEHPYSEDATVLPPDCMAVIVSRDGETQICIPKKLSDDEEVPEPWLALTEVALRFMHDRGWVEDMAADLRQRSDK